MDLEKRQQVLESEVKVMKDTIWRLTSRVYILETFIQQKFGLSRESEADFQASLRYLTQQSHTHPQTVGERSSTLTRPPPEPHLEPEPTSLNLTTSGRSTSESADGPENLSGAHGGNSSTAYQQHQLDRFLESPPRIRRHSFGYRYDSQGHGNLSRSNRSGLIPLFQPSLVLPSSSVSTASSMTVTLIPSGSLHGRGGPSRVGNSDVHHPGHQKDLGSLLMDGHHEDRSHRSIRTRLTLGAMEDGHGPISVITSTHRSLSSSEHGITNSESMGSASGEFSSEQSQNNVDHLQSETSSGANPTSELDLSQNLIKMEPSGEHVRKHSHSEPLFHVDVIPVVGQEGNEESHSAGPSGSTAALSNQDHFWRAGTSTVTAQTPSHLEHDSQGHDCAECNETLQRAGPPSTLREHLEHHDHDHSHHHHPHDSEHGGHFTCDQCGKTFRQLLNLQMHMKFHNGREKKYACEFCDKRFKRAQELTVHRRIHTGEKPYTCPICGKTFSQSSSVTLHLPVHTGEKPYTCSYCSKAFARLSHMKKHVKNIHAQMIIPPPHTQA